MIHDLFEYIFVEVGTPYICFRNCFSNNIFILVIVLLVCIFFMFFPWRFWWWSVWSSLDFVEEFMLVCL